MRRPPVIKKLRTRVGPLEGLAGWPPYRPLLMLHSPGDHPRWARWSILASPQRWFTVEGTSHAALDDLDAALASTRCADGPGGPIPFVGGWIGYISYDLGRVIEPAAQHPSPAGAERSDPWAWPLITLGWCPSALVRDHLEGVWYAIGEPETADLDAMARAPASAAPPVAGAWRSSMPADGYLHAVRRTLAYIAAGDVFQANMTHCLSTRFESAPRALARRALETSAAWYGAFLELPHGRSVISMSPELFLEVNARTRSVRSRPIKGTRPRSVDPRELETSAKDTAELHMIVDLMRNDLGRICRYGTVEVPRPRVIETHAAVHHGVGEVAGVLRADVGVPEILRATMPAGSVTGAPKIRAMQIIDELEPRRRGPYCGAIGFFGDDGAVGLNVAIRTMLLRGEPVDARGAVQRGTIHYGVGGGIVADSDPAAEYRETMDKAAVLRAVFPGAPVPLRAESAFTRS